MRNTTQKSHKKIIGVILVVLALVVSVEMYFGFLHHPEVANNVKINGVFLANAKEINDFQLSSTQEKSFSKANLNGHWTMMFFGFTNCGMVCPTSMAALNGMYKLLEKDLPPTSMPQVVMVSIDPDRDTVQRMKEYVTSFNPNFLGARADINETIKLEKQLHITAAKIQNSPEKNDYYFNHSAEVLIFNPKGQLQAYLSYPHNAEEMAKDYKLILKAIG